MEDGVNGHRGVIALNHVEGVRRIENDTVILQRHLQEEEIVLAPLLAVRGVTHKLVQVHVYSKAIGFHYSYHSLGAVRFYSLD